MTVVNYTLGGRRLRVAAGHAGLRREGTACPTSRSRGSSSASSNAAGGVLRRGRASNPENAKKGMAAMLEGDHQARVQRDHRRRAGGAPSRASLSGFERKPVPRRLRASACSRTGLYLDRKDGVSGVKQNAAVSALTADQVNRRPSSATSKPDSLVKLTAGDKHKM